MIDIIRSGGWLMLPILACSVLALGIILERLWALRRRRVLPPRLVTELRGCRDSGGIDRERLRRLPLKSPLGRIVAAGLTSRTQGREIIKETIEDTGRHVLHELERYLNTLGTIAAITPLLGLLGTVFGMIEVFNVISTQGSGNPQILAGGIAKALITTAAGLTVAIPSLLFHRYFRGRVERLVVGMEQEAMLLLDLIHGSDRSN
ncbi:MAG: MotA/TolQ/ExbB proton channel family protein [Pseudomonadota bacterium]|nr:MotA/TolQ/ExbB proton channel family protein [Pseudomonadota bacterium]